MDIGEIYWHKIGQVKGAFTRVGDGLATNNFDLLFKREEKKKLL